MQEVRSQWKSVRGVALVGSYVPRRCGIATFTSDLAEAIAQRYPQVNAWSVAMNDRPEGYRYPHRVQFEINQQRPGEYRLAADFLNLSNIDVCCLQHEFGLFGGKQGNYILEMLRRLRMPIVTTLHTVLKDPDPDQLDVTRKLGEVSDRLVVMAERASQFLTDVYQIPREKITLIPHGIPDVPFADPNFYKDQFGVEGKKVILTFGLLSPNKGIENMIDALPAIVSRHPDVVYIVLGATHPGVMAHSGEDYRLGLQRRAKELGVEQHLEFVNKFVELDELVEFLGTADVYVTPYLNEAQITSGTLAYAMGTGKPTVSTPYWYAQEMLADGRGVLVPLQNPAALAEAINHLFDHETDRHAIRKRAYQYTRQMRWQDVAARYLDVFADVRNQCNRSPRPSTHSRSLKQNAELLEIKLDHLYMLTDDVGILHSAKSTVPDRRGGYRIEDNAAALIAVLLAHDHLNFTSGSQLDLLTGRYLSFLDYAFDDAMGMFREGLNYDRTWVREGACEDAHARAIWALGEAVARCQTRGHMTLAANLFQRALPGCDNLQYPHAWAYSLIGIHAYLRRFNGDSQARRIRENLAGRLYDRFSASATDDWPWLSDTVTYTAARLPHALLLSGRWMFNDEITQMALRSLDWLHTIQTSEAGQYSPIGSQGWFQRGSEKARFDQHPCEAQATIDASLEAYRVTGDSEWINRAHQAMSWFLGGNDLRLPLYDHTTGGCHDALHAHGANENQSAPATLAWLLSLLSLYEHTYEVNPPSEVEPLRRKKTQPAQGG